MRMWMIPPELLCRQHLLGEHVEIHMLAGSARKGISLDGYLLRNLVEPQHLRERHDLLAEEMRTRGMNHASPLPSLDDLDLPEGNVDLETSLRELRRRCHRCRDRQEKKCLDV